MEDDGAMGTSYFPSDVPIQKHVNVHVMLHLSDRQALCFCPLLGNKGLAVLIPVLAVPVACDN